MRSFLIDRRIRPTLMISFFLLTCMSPIRRLSAAAFTTSSTYKSPSLGVCSKCAGRVNHSNYHSLVKVDVHVAPKRQKYALHYHRNNMNKYIYPSSKSALELSSSTSLSGSASTPLLEMLEQNAQQSSVTSTKSKTVKLYQSLTSKSKVRSQNQKTILEGHRLIIDTLSNPQTRNLYRDVLVTEEALMHPSLGEKLSGQLLSAMNDNHHLNVRLASENVLKAVCDTVSPQGVAAIVDIPKPFCPTDDAIENESGRRDDGTKVKSKFYLIFDGISDPGNVGTLLRSAKAVGAEAVLLLPNSCDVWNPKAIRSAMGTSFQVPIRQCGSWTECMEFLERECGVVGDRIYAATMEDEDGNGDKDKVHIKSKPHFQVDWMNESNALILGKEGPGLSQELRSSVKEGQIRSVYVPMEAGIESLNAAVCGSVIMFEYLRQYQIQVSLD